MDCSSDLATSHLRSAMDRRPEEEAQTSRNSRTAEENIHRQPATQHIPRPNYREHEENLQGGNEQQHHENRYFRERARHEETERTATRRPDTRYTQISLRTANLESWRVHRAREAENGQISDAPSEMGSSVERSDSVAARSQKSNDSRSELVVVSFNCEGWDSTIIEDLLIQLSNSNQHQLALFCQETWLYNLPRNFTRKISSQFNLVHVSAMDPSVPKSTGRPHGGLAAILSKDIAFKTVYENSRCLSLLLIDHNILVNNVYMPFSDSRTTASRNLENYMEALGHLDAVHELEENVERKITLGDFNSAPSDRNSRAEALASWLNETNYRDTDLLWLNEADATHKSGRIIDRICTSENLIPFVSEVSALKSHCNSDHFPVVCKMTQPDPLPPAPKVNQTSRLNWRGASEKSIKAYGNLCNKMCEEDLSRFHTGVIDGKQLYTNV